MKHLYQILAFHPIEAAASISPRLAGKLHEKSIVVGLLLMLVAAMNVVDLLYTLFAHRIGLLKEMNPLAESFLAADLTSSLVAYKLLMVLAGSFLLWRLRENRWAVPACWVLVAVYAGLTVLWYFWVRDVHYIFETMLVLNNRTGF